MKPFNVHCETCGARLKVRDPTSVGEIHACPKCDSMVLIAAPAGWGTSPSLATNLIVASPASGPTVPTDFANEVDSLLQTPEPVTAPADVTASEPVVETNLVESKPAETVPDELEPIAGEPVVAATAGHSGVVVWGIAGLVAFFAVGVMGASWWSRSGGEAADAEVAIKTSMKPAENEEATDSSDVPAPVAVTVSKPPVGEVETDPIAPTAESPIPAALPELPSLPAPVEVAPKEELESEPTTPQSVAEPLPMLDPLAMDAANLDLLLVPENRAAENRADEPAPPEVVAVEQEDVTPRVAIAPRHQRRFEPGSARLGPSFVEAFGEGELQSRLAMQLPSVRWNETPMHQAFAELGNLAGIPITIDPAALRMAAVVATQPVSIAEENATALELASAIAAAGKLTVVEQAGGLVVVKKGADRLRKIEYRVDDLLESGEADATAIAELIRTFVAPNSWASGEKPSIAVNDKSLAIEQQAAVHYEVLLFCERLRKARGLAMRSRYPSDLIHAKPRLARLDAKLSRPTTFTFVDWTPLAQVFSYWQETSGVTMLVDWRALSGQDARPLATMAGSVNSLTWSDALDAMLHPLELDWMPVDGETVQITTRENVSDAVWVEFYAATEAKELRERIAETCDEASLESLVVEADATGKFVLVRGNRQVHQAAAARQ